jgi:hypothetical protein
LILGNPLQGNAVKAASGNPIIFSDASMLWNRRAGFLGSLIEQTSATEQPF